MKDKCKYCIHGSVCAYKEHYEEVEQLYLKVKAEAGKYPWFKCEIRCVMYRKDDGFKVYMDTDSVVKEAKHGKDNRT